MNTLFFGDCLEIIQEQIPDEAVDLIYLDPPFNSNRDYNLLFKTPKGHAVDAQITAFEDSWHWGKQAEQEFDLILHQPRTEVSELMLALRRFLRENDLLAYLTMMTSRLLEMHRVLKSTGSLYLHCDLTVSHYLKLVLDAIFGSINYRNEITWKRTSAHANVGKKYALVQDRLFFYTKSNQWKWTQPYLPYSDSYIKSHYGQIEPDTERYFTTRDLTAPMQRASQGQLYEWKGMRPSSSRCWAYSQENMEKFEQKGRIIYSNRGMPRLKLYLDEMPGTPLDDVWTDLAPINSQASERLGYPTQKPLALLERIIQASSHEGDMVLDPFCGCGTAVHAAQKLGRKWIGIDITHLAISIIEQRIKSAFPGIIFDVQGVPRDLASAQDLARRDKYQFQWWVCSLVNAQPYQGKKKGADSGIDGLLYFRDDDGLAKKIIVSVKGGENVSVSMIRDLKGVLEREKAQIGLFVTLTPPTQSMIKEAITAGYYASPLLGSYPRLQILTVEGLLNDTERALYPDLSRGGETFKQVKPEIPGKQDRLL